MTLLTVLTVLTTMSELYFALRYELQKKRTRLFSFSGNREVAWLRNPTITAFSGSENQSLEDQQG